MIDLEGLAETQAVQRAQAQAAGAPGGGAPSARKGADHVDVALDQAEVEELKEMFASKPREAVDVE